MASSLDHCPRVVLLSQPYKVMGATDPVASILSTDKGGITGTSSRGIQLFPPGTDICCVTALIYYHSELK